MPKGFAKPHLVKSYHTIFVMLEQARPEMRAVSGYLYFFNKSSARAIWRSEPRVPGGPFFTA